MKWYLSVISLWLCASMAHGQAAKIDSIQKILRSELTPSDRALRMKDLAMYYEHVDPSAAIRYYYEAAGFAQKNRLDYETGIIYHNLSFPLTAAGEYSRAIRVLDSALIFLNRSNDPKKTLAIGKVHQALASNHRYNNAPKEAVNYTLQAIGEFEQLKDYSSIVKGYYDLSTLYKSANDPGKQLEAGKKALEAADKSGLRQDRFVAYSVLVHAYINVSDFKTAASVRDSALTYYDKNYSPNALIAFHLVSGFINMTLGGLEKAKTDFAAGLQIARDNRHTFSIVQSQMQLAKVLLMQKHYGEAEKVLHAADTVIAKSKESSQRLVLLEYYEELYEAQGKYQTALEYTKSYLALNDSVATLENRKYITELETKYESGKKEAQIKQMQLERQVQQLAIRQKNNLNYMLGGLAALLLVSFFFAFNNYRQKQRLQRQRIAELETEKQLMATEAVLKGEELERSRLAKDLHDGLGGMLSGIKYSLDTMKRNLIMTPENQQAFERSIDMLDSSIHEMRRVAHNMMPESLVNFGIDTALKEFCMDITDSGAITISYQSIGLQGEPIDQTVAITIYRIVQELINNIIKHAAAKNAIVQVSKTGKDLSITVEDDGKGFDASLLDAPETAGRRGMGWSNIQNRIGLLKGRMDVKSLSGNGTSVLIEFSI